MRNLLVYRLILLNACAGALLAWAAAAGLVGPLFSGAGAPLAAAIALLACAGLVSAFTRAAKISRGLNRLDRDRLWHAENHVVNGPKLLEKGEHLADIANWLVVLGLLGTVIGFQVALEGIDQAGLSSAAGVRQAAAQLMAGMRIALGTTLAGGFAGLWIDINRRVIRTAAVQLAEDSRQDR